MYTCVCIFVYVCLMGSFLLKVFHISDIIAWCVYDVCVCVCACIYRVTWCVFVCVHACVHPQMCVCEGKLGECRGRCV